MRATASKVCLWMAAVTLAVSVGGNLYQAIVLDPVWSASPPESLKAFAATPYLDHVVTFHTSPVFLVGLLCLLASPFLAWKAPAMRLWLLIAVGFYLAVILSTVLFFAPINRVLFTSAGNGVDPATIIAMTRHWLLADRIRYACRLAAFLCVLRAMVLSGAGLVGR